MQEKTKGAWIINHAKRNAEVSNSYDFPAIDLAGKCGILLSNLSESEAESNLSKEKVQAAAQISGVNAIELPKVLETLQGERLIDLSTTGEVQVIAVSTATVLEYTSNIFEGSDPNAFQRASIGLSETVSDLPKESKGLTEFVSDEFELSTSETIDLLSQAEAIGFVDSEQIDKDSKLYFNGNLFRRDVARKASHVLGSLGDQDATKIAEVDSLLAEKGCDELKAIEVILGIPLLEKLLSIGMYDVLKVSNSKESKEYVTKPSAFAKYGDPFEEDALDLAKAFVASLQYGMTRSSAGRGRIQAVGLLLRKLIRGYSVGPATAIGQDYRLLELRRVVELTPGQTPGTFSMRLLKKDIGELALHVLESGDASETDAIQSKLLSSSVTSFVGPERNRRAIRQKKENAQTAEGVGRMLRTFRAND
jgi:hypothetical protein